MTKPEFMQTTAARYSGFATCLQHQQHQWINGLVLAAEHSSPDERLTDNRARGLWVKDEPFASRRNI